MITPCRSSSPIRRRLLPSSSFGASSLDLVVYAYLADVSSRTRTMSDLHTEIDKRFAAAGIDIPNPQFDLHLHKEGEVSRGAAPAI